MNGLAVALVGNAILTAVVVVLHGGTALGVRFAAFVALTAVLAWWAGPLVGVGSVALGWLFYSGFLIGRHGHLSWQPADGSRLILLAGAVVVAVAARVALTRWSH